MADGHDHQAHALANGTSRPELASAVTALNEQKRKDGQYARSEAALTQWGYDLLASQSNVAAVKVFELNVARHPSSSNAYDSLEGQHAASYLLQSRRCVSGGPPQVYLDGVPLAPTPPARPSQHTNPEQSAAWPFDLAEINVSDLAGVEYYPDGTMLPEEFDHTSLRCGALLLWTREK